MAQGARQARTTAAALVLLAAAAGAAGFLISQPGRPRQTPPQVTPFPPPTTTPTAVPNGPVSGFGFSVADDPATHDVVLFGGVDNYNNTWLWNGHRWSLAHPATSPPGRFRSASAYDPLTRTVFLYGGRLQQGDLVDDTWSWDGTNWHELDPGTGNPPPGEDAVMFWDDAHSDMVLVASSPSTQTDETWVWGGTRWTRIINGDLPATVFVAWLAFDPISRALLPVAHTTQTDPASTATATFSWDGATWHRIMSQRDPSSVAGLSLDPSIGRLLISVGLEAGEMPQEFIWNGQSWESHDVRQLPVQPGVEVTDIDRGRVLLFGSFQPSTQGAPQAVHVWERIAPGWMQLDTAVSSMPTGFYMPSISLVAQMKRAHEPRPAPASSPFAEPPPSAQAWERFVELELASARRLRVSVACLHNGHVPRPRLRSITGLRVIRV
jgi:hypothetical protein